MRKRISTIEPRVAQQALMLETSFCLANGNEPGKKNALGLYDSMMKDRVYHNTPSGIHEFI